MRKLFTGLTIAFILQLFSGISHAEGTKQLMPNSSDRLWLEFNVFGTGSSSFAGYNCSAEKRLNIRLVAGEKVFFGFKMNTINYGGDVYTKPNNAYYRIRKPDGSIAVAESNIPTSGAGYIANYSQATTGPNGAKLNGVTITGGYTPKTFTADQTGDYYIEFRYYNNYRFALEFFDITVTDSNNNIITNPGEPNKPAGRIWSKTWQLTTTSFTQYPVNNYFYVFTSDDFVNKINFQYYPFSFTFQSNSYGLINPTNEPNYIKRAQSKDNDQTSAASEYRIYLNDPDRNIWPTTRLAAPKTQVWANDTLFFDYQYDRTPQQLAFADHDIYLTKNKVGCEYSSIAIFKINSNIDAFTAILIDLDGDGGYSTAGNDRVIYRNMRRGNNYILWNFKNDAGAEVATGVYHASATFMGRGPTNFPVFDVEQCDGVITSSIRPFRKLNATIYWDDTYISRWGDETGHGLMDETQRKQLKVSTIIPRIWSWNANLENTNFNGNLNTMNTWFNAIDLGYSDITIHVNQSTTQCINGLAPWVGDIYKQGLPNNTITFTQADFTTKFFDPIEDPLTRIRIKSLPANGSLKLSGTAVTVNQEITLANLANLTFTPNTGWVGITQFDWEAKNSQFWSMNTDKVYITVNTPPTISSIADQNLCTNNPSPAIPFTVNDSETPAANLTVTAYSHDPTFVPNSSITIGGSGTNRTISVTPVANKSGHAIIYVMVDDGLSQTIQEFAVYVGPDLEFSGDTTICVGQDLYLVAQEVGASSYTWKYNGTVVASTQTLSKAWGSFSAGSWSLTVSKGSCVSTRNFQVTIFPLTTFTGDQNVCVGEEINLSATENNASYEWKKGTTIVSSTKQFVKPSATLSDAGTNYTLKVTKSGCSATSNPFAITVINAPNVGLTVTGSTVDPGRNGTITIGSAQSGVTYNIYKNETLITSGVGAGANLTITVPAANLSVGSNLFVVKADNGNCEVPLSSTATITVREPGFTITVISANTTEAGGTASFTVVCKTQPLANVILQFTSTDLTEGTVVSSITFTTANWNTPQTVTVTGVDDYVVDGNISYTIQVGPSSSSDSYYNGIDPPDINMVNTDNDVAAVVVNPTSGLTTTEAGGTATFTVRLAAQPGANVSLTLNSSNTAEGTVSPASLTFTSADWATPKTVTVTGVDDYVDDGDVTYFIQTSGTTSTDPLFNNLNVADVTVINTNNDVAGIVVQPTSGLTTTEAGGQANFTIRLNSQPVSSVTVGLSSSNTGEGAVSPLSVTFNAGNWNLSQTITVTGVNDDVDDGNQSYTIVTAPATSTDTRYSGTNASDVSVVNIDDDDAGIIVSPISGLITTEAGGSATFTVKLNSKPTANVTIALTSSKPAEGAVSPSTLTFTPSNWSTNQTVTITGVDDFVDDGNQSYTINGLASSSDGNYTGRSFTVSATNTDNDEAGITVAPTSGLTTSESGGQATFTIVLNSQPTADVTIGLSSSNTAEGTVSPTSITFTSATWSIAQTISITGVDDMVADGPVSYTIVTATASSSDSKYSGLDPADVSVINNDNDVAGITVTPTVLTTSEAGSSVTFTIVLNTKPSGDVTINLSSNDLTEGTVSPVSVTFTTTTWNTPKVATVTPVNDDEDDGDVAYTIVTSNATSSDPGYNNMNPADVTVTNVNDDVAGFTVSPTAGLQTTEAGGTATFTVKLNSKPTANVTINLSSSNPAEGTVNPTSLTFTPTGWNTSQTITITGVNDDVDDDNVAYTIITSVATSTDAKYSGLNPTDVSVTNIDNDTAGFTVSPTTGLQTTEAGGTATFTVKLNSKPTADVTISIASSNPAEGTINPTSLTFTPTGWNTPQTITITGVNDDVDDDNVAYTIITNPATSTDTKYSGVNPTDVSVTNIDNDTAGYTVNPTSGLQTTETGGITTFTIRLNTRPTANVTISITSSNTNEGTVIPTSVTFTPATWSNPQTITITGVDDDIDDDNVAYTIITGAATSSDTKYSGLNPADVSVTNIDNDTAGFTVNPTSGLQTTEAGGTATFTVKLNSKPTADVTITLASSNPAEGTVNPTSLTFTSGNWNSLQTATITGVDDDVDDDNVTYTITTGTATSTDAKYNGLNPPDVSATNIDNDDAGVAVSPYEGLYTTEAGGTATFTMKLTSKPTANVSITLVSLNTNEGVVSPSTVPFTPDNWNTNQTITVTGMDDDVDDDNVAYTIQTQPCISSDPKYDELNPVDVSLTNIDNDNAGYILSQQNITYSESDSPVSVTYRLSSKPTANVSFNLESLNTSKGTASPASLTFTSGNWNVEQVVTITPVNNYVVDGDATFAIAAYSATSGDSKYNGLNPPDINVTCTDDDVAAINVSAISGNTREDGTTATFTIVLNSQPAADVTIGLSSSNTAEGTVSPASVTFTSSTWNVAQTVTVTGVNDVVADGNITYTVIIGAATSADPNYNGLNPDDIAVINIDDDQAGVNVFPVSGLTTKEDGSTATFQISLNTAPVSNVTISFASSDATEGTVSPTQQVFNNTSWNSPATITITGVDDLAEDGDQPYTVTISSASSDPNYNNLSIPSVSVTNLDDTKPRAADDAATTPEKDPVQVDVLANDKGLDKNGIVVTIAANPTHGSVAVQPDNTITYTPNGLFNGDDTFTYRVTDRDGGYDEANVTITVTFVNDIPVAVDDARGTSINTPRVVDVLFNDHGLEDGGISVTITEAPNPTQGNATANADNTVTFTPASGYLGVATFKYKVEDVNGDSDEATVTINVRPVNHIPDAVDDNATTFINTAQKINVLANDAGLDDGFGSLIIFANPAHGIVVVNPDRTITYTPDAGFSGTDNFSYLIEDVDGDYDIAVVTITVTSVPNHLPTAYDDYRGASRNTPVTVDVLINDTGLEDGIQNLTVTTQPVNGNALVNPDHTITYTPNTDFVGVEIFGYQVCDVDGDCSTANVHINVKEGINIVPVANDDTDSTIVNTPKSINVLANDTGLDDGLGSITIFQQPEFGAVVVNANRTITYTPTYMFVGTETFRYMVTDLDGDYDIATVTIKVKERPNYIPVANDDRRGCSFETPVVVDVLFNDTGLEDTPITVSISQQPTSGNAIVNPADNTVTYTPATGFIGEMTFRYTVADADGDSDDALVTIKVKSGVNMVPISNADNATTIMNNPVTINVLSNDTGLDDGFGGLYIYQQPEFGTVVLNANRSVTYTPAHMFVGVETFRYYVEDADGDYSLATVTVTVIEKPNYVPIANDDYRGCSFNSSVTVDVLSNDTGIDDVPLTLSININPTDGNAQVNPDNTITFTPFDGFIGLTTFGYRVTDANGDSDEAMVFINVKAGINAVPLARDDNAHTFINKSVEINVLANDEGLDDGFGALTIRQQPAFGTVVVNANRTLTYFPGYMFVGSDSFSYMVEDVDGDYSVAIVTVVVDEKPDSKPVANDDSRGCSFNSAVTVDVLINDSGLDDVPLAVSVTEAPQSGSAVPNPDNTITFTPEANFTGTITFRYTVTDVDGDFDDAQVTIHVKAGQNIVPYAVPDNATTLVNKPAVVNVLANDTGLDDGFGSLTVFEQPKFGSVVVNSNRTVTYTPSYMFIGVETFRYMVTDVDGDYAIGTVTITVIEKPNSIPVANDDLRGCSFETPVVVDVLVNDTGLEDVPLTLTISELPTIGSTVVNPNNTITFTPPAAFTGIATFRYTVTDSDGDSDDALVTIRVKEGENYVPHSNDDAASTIINTNVDINVLANDTGLDDGFERLIIFEMPSFGTVTVNENRTVTYTPSYMFLGTDTFRYWVEDVDGDYSIATVTVEVTERPNYLPVANDDYRATSLNTPRIVDVLVNDTGLDDTPVEVSITNQASHGTTVVEADNTVTYTPQNSYLGADHFSYRVTDRDGDWDEATVFIDVKPVNMIPVAVDDYVQTYVNQPVDIHVLENDSLLYEGIKSLQVFSAPKWGTVQVNDNHTITYTPSYFFIGNDEFKYLVEDVDGDYDIATVYVVVLATQNAIPVANDDHRATSKNTPLDINVLINDDGLDDGWIRVFIDEFPDAATGTAAVKPDNMVSFTPATDYLGLSTLKYFIVDRNNDTSNVATVTVNVKEVNFIPVANADTASTNMNVPLLVDVVNNDTGLDDGLDYIKVMGKPLHGFAYAFDNHNIKYFPSSWFVGTDSLTYLVADEDGDYDIGKLYITVNERPDHKPLANPDGRGTTTNTPVTVDVLFNDTGLEDGGIKVLLNIFPINGNVLLNADNTVTYTPNTGFLGEDVFYYQVCDFDSDCSSAAVTINVKNANLVPIAYNDTVTTFKNKAISINVLFNDRNLNDGGIRTVVFSNPTNGAVSVNPDNSILYTPANNFFGVDSLWYYVADVDGDYSLAKVVIDVLNRENFTPQANDDDVEIFMDTETTIDVLANDIGLNDGVKALAVETSPTNGICRITSDFKVYYSPLTGFVGTETFTYRVTDRDDESSVAYITVRVVPDPDGKVVVPEAFSPNGDGFNDTFEVLNIGQFQHITLKVYNRWGNLVYKSDRYKNDWDGTANVSLSLGSKLPAGTYYYLLEILDTGKTYKGSVFIKR